MRQEIYREYAVRLPHIDVYIYIFLLVVIVQKQKEWNKHVWLSAIRLDSTSTTNREMYRHPAAPGILFPLFFDKSIACVDASFVTNKQRTLIASET